MIHNMLFFRDIFYGRGGGCTKKQGIHFRHELKGKIVVPPPVVKLRHAKVVVSRQYSRKKPVSGMHSSRYRIVFLFFFLPRRLFGGILAVCFVVAVVPDSVAVVVCRLGASGRVGT